MTRHFLPRASPGVTEVGIPGDHHTRYKRGQHAAAISTLRPSALVSFGFKVLHSLKGARLPAVACCWLCKRRFF